MSYNGMDGQSSAENFSQTPRSAVPTRRDVCRLLLSGDIATDPRESYLSNGHYVINFQLAVVGHYLPVHDWEKFKPTETMWISCEVWDEEAKQNHPILQKGSQIGGMGALILNKWVDKQSGEDRKMLKFRILQLMPVDDLKLISNSLGLEDEISMSAQDPFEDNSNFSRNFPPEVDQTRGINKNTGFPPTVHSNSSPAARSSGTRAANSISNPGPPNPTAPLPGMRSTAANTAATAAGSTHATAVKKSYSSDFTQQNSDGSSRNSKIPF